MFTLSFNPGTIGRYILRLLIVIFSLSFSAIGITLTLQSKIGLGPWDVLHQGLSLRTPLTFGMAVIVVGLVVVCLGLMLKVYPGIGTLLNIVLIGVYIDWLLYFHVIPDFGESHWLIRLAVNVIGIFLLGLGTAAYISPRLGAGPRDGLMLRLHEITRLRIAFVRGIIECTVLLIGFLLGGTVGIGTVLAAFLIGPAIEVGFWCVRWMPSLLGLPEAPSKHRPTVLELDSDEHEESDHIATRQPQ